MSNRGRGKYASVIKDKRPKKAKKKPTASSTPTPSPTQADGTTLQSTATTASIDQDQLANDEKVPVANQTKMFDVGEKQVTEHQCGTPNFLISKGKV